MTAEVPTPSRVRRMLPSVSEVLKELTARVPVEPDVAFRAAREVCAEELKRIRDAGGDSVPLEELVRRALARVAEGRTAAPSSPSVAAVPAARAPGPPAEAGPAFDDEPAPLFAPPSAPVDEPFSETTGAMDLRWEPDPHEPFAEAVSALPVAPEARKVAEPPVDSPGASALPPPADRGIPVPFALPAEEDVFEGTEPSPEAPPPPFLTEEGPGDETLTRLSREAESIDLKAVFPRPVPDVTAPAEPRRTGEEPPPAPRAEEGTPSFEDEEDTVLTIPRGGRRRGKGRSPRVGLLLGVAASLVALAGLGYLLVGLWVERDAAPAPVAVARPRPSASPAPAAALSEPAVESAEAPGLVGSPAATEPVPVVDAAPGPATVPPAATAPGPRTPAEPLTAAPAPAPPEPSPVEAVTTPPVRAVPVPRSRDGLVVTRDREGEPQVFSIHFTSYRDRVSAERDLRRIEGIVGRDGYVAEVDLGEKGVWQRVMIGAFPTAQEARAVREELAAKGTRDMGWVYRVVGPEGPFPP